MRKKQENQSPDMDMPEVINAEPIENEDGQEVLEAEVVDIAALKEALKAAEEKREEYLTLAQRVQADFDNYRRRNNAARAEAFDEGAVAFIKTLLPVIDNMERAVASAKDTSDEALRDGVNMICTQLNEVLLKRGVNPIDRVGEKFDPNLENAVLRGTEEDGEPGTVCEVFQKGYQIDKFVIRHAMVKVVPD